MFSESSTGHWALVQLPCCPSKRGELPENILQKTSCRLYIPAHTTNNLLNTGPGRATKPEPNQLWCVGHVQQREGRPLCDASQPGVQDAGVGAGGARQA